MSSTFSVYAIVIQDPFCMHAYTAQSKIVSRDNGLCSLSNIHLLCCVYTMLNLHTLVGPTGERASMPVRMSVGVCFNCTTSGRIIIKFLLGVFSKIFEAI